MSIKFINKNSSPIEIKEVYYNNTELEQVNFNGENVFEKNKQQSPIAGLYETGSTTLKLSWQELLDQNILNVNGNTLSGNNTNARETSGDLIINDVIESISNATFYAYHNLTKIVIPNGVKILGESSFGETTSLTEIIIPKTVTQVGRACFERCRNITNVQILSDNVVLSDYAFLALQALENITLTKGVKSLGDSVFWACDNLKTITLESKTPPPLAGDLVIGVPNTLTIRVPNAAVDIYKNAENWSKYAEIITGY